MKIAITGCSGHIGSYIVCDLAKKYPDAELILVDKIIDDNFYGEDAKVKFNSEATDIFINDGDTELKQNCMIEINPQKMEYLTIPNTVGDKDKGILIGDYKIKKEKNQSFQKEGIMEISLLEDDSQKQAF